PVAPAVRAEQGDFLPFQLGLAAFEHGGEFALLQLFAAHGGAAKSDGVEAVHQGGVEFGGGEQGSFPASPGDSLRHGGGHGFGVSRPAPIDYSDFTHLVSNLSVW